METARPMFSLVIPVYRNLGSLPELLRQVGALAERLPGALELVMVVDASPDGSYGYLLEHLPRQAFDSQLLLLARNFGSFAAIREGVLVIEVVRSVLAEAAPRGRASAASLVRQGRSHWLGRQSQIPGPRCQRHHQRRQIQLHGHYGRT